MIGCSAPVLQHAEIEVQGLLLYEALHFAWAQVCNVIHGLGCLQQCHVNHTLPVLLCSLYNINPKFVVCCLFLTCVQRVQPRISFTKVDVSSFACLLELLTLVSTP